ncbi:tkl protein kinase, partial [Nannochloropsis oceanica]
MTRAVVLMPSALVCGKHSPYRHAIEAALVAQSAGAAGNTVDWEWQEPDGERTRASSHNGSRSSRGVASTTTTNSLQAQAHALLKSDPNVDLVLVPSLEPPYQAHYFTRVFRGGTDNNSNNGSRDSDSKKRAAPVSYPAGGSSFSPSFMIHMTTLRLGPTERTYLTATALCRHFGWGHVALLSSDDNHMQAAQGLRQQLTAEGIHIRRHHIFSPAGSGSLHSKSNPSPLSSSGSGVEHDLDAIRTSGARIVFLLSSCRATHEVLSAARRKGMLRDYAWVVLHPTSACALDSSSSVSSLSSSSSAAAKGMDDHFEGGDLALLEMYQGVLGLAWDGAMAAGDAAWPKMGVEINASAIPREAVEASAALGLPFLSFLLLVLLL